VGKRIKKSKMNFRSACTIFGGGFRAPPAGGPTTLVEPILWVNVTKSSGFK